MTMRIQTKNDKKILRECNEEISKLETIIKQLSAVIINLTRQQAGSASAAVTIPAP